MELFCLTHINFEHKIKGNQLKSASSVNYRPCNRGRPSCYKLVVTFYGWPNLRRRNGDGNYEALVSQLLLDTAMTNITADHSTLSQQVGKSPQNPLRAAFQAIISCLDLWMPSPAISGESLQPNSRSLKTSNNSMDTNVSLQKKALSFQLTVLYLQHSETYVI